MSRKRRLDADDSDNKRRRLNQQHHDDSDDSSDSDYNPEDEIMTDTDITSESTDEYDFNDDFLVKERSVALDTDTPEQSPFIGINLIVPRYRKVSVNSSFESNINKLQLSLREKDYILNQFNQVSKINEAVIPDKIKILQIRDMNLNIKAEIIKKLDLIETSASDSSIKLKEWVQNILKIPFGKYHKLPMVSSKKFLTNKIDEFYNTLDKSIYGQKNVKETLIEITLKWMLKNDTKGNCIAIVGPAGVGKTTLIRNGLAKMLNRPFCTLSLAGMNDDSYISGFPFTYEGSDHGRIVKMLIEANCMNPIIFMDELDKVDTSHKGVSVINKLIELTDFSQNHEFEDLYFNNIKFDISKCIFVFSLNNLNNVDPILRDRLEVIHVGGFDVNEKVKIAKDYMINNLLVENGFKLGDVIFTDKIIKYIISATTKNEEGVRELKRNIDIILRKLQVMINSSNKKISYNKFQITFPLIVTHNMIDKLLGNKKEVIPMSIQRMYI